MQKQRYCFHSIDGTHSVCVMATDAQSAKTMKNNLVGDKLSQYSRPLPGDIFKHRYATADDVLAVLAVTKTLSELADLYYNNLELIDRKGNEKLKDTFNAYKAEVSKNRPTEDEVAVEQGMKELIKMMVSGLRGLMFWQGGINSRESKNAKERAQALILKATSNPEIVVPGSDLESFLLEELKRIKGMATYGDADNVYSLRHMLTRIAAWADSAIAKVTGEEATVDVS